MKSDPWYKTTLGFNPLGLHLQLDVPNDLFSTLRIDEGTELFLKHLPAQIPKSVLDVGCGYGALGIPIAAHFPDARVELVDRDLLAVKWAQHNVRKNQLANVQCYGSLGYRDLNQPESQFDWIVCNVPARIGKPFIVDLIKKGQKKLTPGGMLQIVVIKDLGPTIEEIKVENSLKIQEITRGPRHTIYSILADSNPNQVHEPNPAPEEAELLYMRDQVKWMNLDFDRPFDLGGDDPKRLASSLPLLIDALPKNITGNVLCVRGAYGILPVICRKRWPGANIYSIERDLLASTFQKRNALKNSVLNEQFTLIEAPGIAEALKNDLLKDLKFDFVVGELSPSTGAKGTIAEIASLTPVLKSSGRALLLILNKLISEYRIPLTPLMSRESLSLITF